MDDCKGVCYELAKKDTAQCLAHDIGRAFLDLLGWASPALVILAFVVVAFGVHAPRAYALSAKSSPEMVIDGNMVGDDAGSKGYLCVNCSPYTATLELIGHYSDIIQITNEQYAWLTGGNNPFATLVDKWQELRGGEGDEPTNTWMGGDDFLDGWLILAGKGNCWYGTFTDNEIRMAEIAFNSIMQGGTGEEGGGDDPGFGTDGDWQYVDLPATRDPNESGTVATYAVNSMSVASSGVGSVTFGSKVSDEEWSEDNPFVLYVDPASLTNMSDYITSKGLDPDSMHYIYCRSWSATYVIATDKEIEIVRNSNSSWFYVKNNNEEVVTVITFNSKQAKCGMYKDKPTCFLINASKNLDFTVGAGKTNTTNPLRPYWSSEGDAQDPTPPEPPDVQPPDDDPEPPSPTPPTPDPPKPKDPTPRDPITKPDPPTVYPKIELPDVNVTIEPTNTEPTDYTPWLRAIYQELKAFHEDFGTYFQDLLDELENHCQHIRDEIATQASYLGDCVEDVANEVAQQGNSLSNTIWEYADWLSKYMDAFGEWLVEHLDFNNEVNVDPYDDTSLMYWLRRIYTKLGGSSNPINTRPTDPVLNPKDTGNWLNELWETILKELAQLFPNLMIDLGLIFDDLKSKFPFSIPWDIHALLLLLVTEPVAPHFTVPMYAFTTSYELEQIGEYDIDLSFYTDYLMGVHLMLEIAWIGYMLKHTKDYMELIEAVIPS